jgi:predicted nucleotidyltransferase
MCTRNELEIITKKMTRIYRDVFGSDIVKILLYGSYARHDYDDESDIDIVAIVKGNRAELQELLKKIWNESSELELEYETIISPTVIPYDEFTQYQEALPYYCNIVREGIEISA